MSMTDTEFSRRMAALEEQHQAESKRLQEAAARNNRAAVKSEIVRAFNNTPGTCKLAADDAAEQILQTLRVGDDGVAVDAKTGEPADLKVIVDAHVASRPYLKSDAPPSKFGPSVGESWDLERAKVDGEYMMAWKRADAEGFARAWGLMLEKVAGRATGTSEFIGDDADIERAKRDSRFMSEWKSRDPRGFAYRWNRELERIAKIRPAR